MDLQNFPQPTRPLSFSKLTSFKYSAPIIQPSEPISHPYGDHEEEVFGELTKILLECLENVDNKHKGLLLQKIFKEVEKESEMETFIIEKLKQTEVKVISEFLERYSSSLHDQEESVSRGFDDDDLVEAHRSIERKLERFKVKPVIIEGDSVIKK